MLGVVDTQTPEGDVQSLVPCIHQIFFSCNREKCLSQNCSNKTTLRQLKLDFTKNNEGDKLNV